MDAADLATLALRSLEIADQAQAALGGDDEAAALESWVEAAPLKLAA